MSGLIEHAQKGKHQKHPGLIRIALLTGLRRNDILQIKEANIKNDGIYIFISKTKKPIIFEWSEDLKRAVQLAREARPVDIAPYLFCNKRGRCYVDEKTGQPEGFKSMWQRFMDRVVKETAVSERFTMHDLRAKCGSDAESLERAQQILAHADARTTKRIYRRKPERIRPAKVSDL